MANSHAIHHNFAASIPSEMEERISMARSLFILAGMVFLVMIWGAVVRLTGSGLSIPDWPLINGSLLPPFTASGWEIVKFSYHEEALRLSRAAFPPDIPLAQFQTMFWIEYFHRALAMLVGLWFVWILIKGFRSRILSNLLDTRLYLLGALLLTQAGLGGIVVKGALSAVMIAVHLSVAYLFFGMIVMTALSLNRSSQVVQGGSASAGYTPVRLVWWTIAALSVQVIMGGLMSGNKAGSVFNTYPTMLGSIFPPGDLFWSNEFGGFIGNITTNPVMIQFIHRWWPLALLGCFAGLRASLIGAVLSSRAHMVLITAESLLALQIVIGVINLLYAAPLLISGLHSAIALALFGCLIVLQHDLRFEAGDVI